MQLIGDPDLDNLGLAPASVGPPAAFASATSRNLTVCGDFSKPQKDRNNWKNMCSYIFIEIDIARYPTRIVLKIVGYIMI